MEDLARKTGPHIAHRSNLLVIPLLQILVIACSSPTSTAPVEEAVENRSDPEMLERRRELLRNKQPERAPEPGAPVTGEVPEVVMESAMLALEKLTGAERSTFDVVAAEETIWSDGALGCSQPGMTYTQAPVPGYHIVLEHEARQYDYRSGGTRYLMLCLEPSGQIPSGTAPPVR